MSIILSKLTKIYNPETDFPVTAVDRVSLSINQGEFLAIMGPSGSGKTTLLNMMGGIDRPSTGTVVVDGTDITDLNDKKLITFRRDHIGFIFQNYSLLPVLTALENVMFVMQLQGRPPQECQARAEALLTEVGLAERFHKVPAKLSGGEQQRVAVARALAPKPQFILADEPTANLDAASTRGLLDIMQQLNEREGSTFIFSTHDPRVIERARRVIVFEDGHITEDRSQ
jgi:putative ABC transport system ATP-binding protein